MASFSKGTRLSLDEFKDSSPAALSVQLSFRTLSNDTVSRQLLLQINDQAGVLFNISLVNRTVLVEHGVNVTVQSDVAYTKGQWSSLGLTCDSSSNSLQLSVTDSVVGL